DRLRAGHRHLVGAQADAAGDLLRGQQGALRQPARPVRPQHARRALGAGGHVAGGRVRLADATQGACVSPTATEAVLRIGDVARLVGTTPRTIRYYEEIGLLPGGGEREAGRHRAYGERDVERLRDTLRLKDLLGLSLDELK